MVILSAFLAESGNIYLLDMGKPIRIVDLALKMMQISGPQVNNTIRIAYIGLRPGERLHEVLIAANEELQPTGHSKIFRVACQDPVPSPTTLAHWVQTLEDCLFEDNDERLRQCIFDFICQCKPLVVS